MSYPPGHPGYWNPYGQPLQSYIPYFQNFPAQPAYATPQCYQNAPSQQVPSYAPPQQKQQQHTPTLPPVHWTRASGLKRTASEAGMSEQRQRTQPEPQSYVSSHQSTPSPIQLNETTRARCTHLEELNAQLIRERDAARVDCALHAEERSMWAEEKERLHAERRERDSELAAERAVNAELRGDVERLKERMAAAEKAEREKERKRRCGGGAKRATVVRTMKGKEGVRSR